MCENNKKDFSADNILPEKDVKIIELELKREEKVSFWMCPQCKNMLARTHLTAEGRCPDCGVPAYIPTSVISLEELDIILRARHSKRLIIEST